MFPIAIDQAVSGAWVGLAANLIISAAVAVGILHRHGQLRRG